MPLGLLLLLLTCVRGSSFAVCVQKCLPAACAELSYKLRTKGVFRTYVSSSFRFGETPLLNRRQGHANSKTRFDM